MSSSIIRFYRKPAFTEAKTKEILNKLVQKNENVSNLQTELCYYIEVDKKLTEKEKNILKWVLRNPFYPADLTEETSLKSTSDATIIEVGPRFNFSTANSTNAVSICKSLGLNNVVRLECSRRYLISLRKKPTAELENALAAVLHDRMTECRYIPENIPKNSFNEKLKKKEELHDVDVLKKGRQAFVEINNELGLAFDEADIDYYTNLFKNVLKRNPTSVECFDLAQSNSEHSRHWFFKGKMIVDGEEYEDSLIDMIVDTQKHSNPNNVIKFSDNSRLVKKKIIPISCNYFL